jgi:hypothetical protein
MNNPVTEEMDGELESQLETLIESNNRGGQSE